jgi:chromosome segregation ATPase
MINSFIKKYKEIEEAIEREVKSSTNAESSGTYASSSREPVSRAESQTPSTMFFNSVAMGSESPQRGSGGVNENQTSLPPRSLSAEPSTGNTQGFDALIAENEKLKEMLQFVKTKAKAKISSLQEEVNQLKANNDATQKDSEQQRSDDIDTSGATVKSINTSLDEYKSRVTELEQRNLELNEALSAAVDDLSRLKQYERDSHLLPETTTSYNKELQTEPVVNEHEALSVSLQAQVKELKSQLALISKDAAEFSEVVKRLKEEKQSIIVAHEEKLKKIKDLFAVGNKNLAELKETLSQKETLLDVKIAEIAAKDTRIVQLENQLRESLEALRQTYDERDALQSGASAQASEFEAKFKSAQEELNRTRLDFQAYKNRAYAVLQERQNDQQQKILSDLEVKIAKLEAEKNAVAKSLEASLLRTKELDTSLQTSLDINSALQKRLDELHSFEEQYENAKEELRQEILNKKAFQQSLQEGMQFIN